MSKRFVYYCAFTLLGLLLASLLHAVIEIPTLHIITSDFSQYGDSWLWQNWSLVHGVGGFLLWVLGAGVGLWCGIHYWPRAKTRGVIEEA